MTPTDPTPEELDELARLLAQPKAGTLLDAEDADRARAAGIPLRPHYASAAAKASGEPSAWYVLPDDVAERAFVEDVMRLLPRLLSAARKWARAREVLERALADYDARMAAITAANYDDAGYYGMELRDTLASLLAPTGDAGGGDDAG